MITISSYMDNRGPIFEGAECNMRRGRIHIGGVDKGLHSNQQVSLEKL